MNWLIWNECRREIHKMKKRKKKDKHNQLKCIHSLFYMHSAYSTCFPYYSHSVHHHHHHHPHISFTEPLTKKKRKRKDKKNAVKKGKKETNLIPSISFSVINAMHTQAPIYKGI